MKKKKKVLPIKNKDKNGKNVNKNGDFKRLG